MQVYYPNGLRPETEASYFYNRDGFTYYPPDVGAGGGSLGGISEFGSTMSTTELVTVADSMIDKAEGGLFSDPEPLSDYRKAGAPNSLFMGSTTVGEAQLKTAYWLAVAARLQYGKGNEPQGKYLAEMARYIQRQGLKNILPGMREKSATKIQGVYQKAVGLTDKYGERGISGILKQAGLPQSGNVTRQVREDSRVVYNTAKKSADDVAHEVEETARALRSGLGVGEEEKMSPWVKLGIGVGVLGAGFLAYQMFIARSPAALAAKAAMGKRDEDEDE